MQIPLLAAFALAACTGPQSMLDPAGPGAREAAMLWWPMFPLSAGLLMWGPGGLAYVADAAWIVWHRLVCEAKASGERMP